MQRLHFDLLQVETGVLVHRILKFLHTSLKLDSIFPFLQLPALIQQMFEALNLLNELLPDLPHTIPTTPSLTLAVEGLIGDQLSILPPGQSVEILEIVNKHILKKYLAKCNDGGCVQADSTELSASPRYQDVSLLERTVDIARVVLSHSAPAIWAGREKEKALLLLQNLSEDICSPLLSKAATSVSELMCCICVTFELYTLSSRGSIMHWCPHPFSR